jgi:hypothetical protein
MSQTQYAPKRASATAPAGVLQRAAINPARVEAIPPLVPEVLRDPGQPLEANIRAVMEPRFGHDFSQVRVHTDTRAAESARAVNALAYTVGRDVVFGAGQYAPASSQGQRVLGHELTHVVQQRAYHTQQPQALAVGPADDPLEREAQRAAAGLATPGTSFAGQAAREAMIQRQPAPSTDDTKKPQGGKEVTTQPQPQQVPVAEVRKEYTVAAAPEKGGVEATATLSTETEAKRGKTGLQAETSDKFELEVAIPITDKLQLGRLQFLKEASVAGSLGFPTPGLGPKPLSSLELETSLKVLSLEFEKVKVPLGVADFELSGSALGSAGYDVVGSKSAFKLGFAGEAEAKFKPGEKSPFFITAKVGVERTYNRDGSNAFQWGPMTWKGAVGAGFNF